MDWQSLIVLFCLSVVYLWLRFAAARLLLSTFVRYLREPKEENVRVVIFTPENKKISRPGVLIDGVPYRDVTDEVR